ncbi:MAG: MBL fold metallo-hydrolase [Planctomycetota bacterium]|jgi:phosphoribosyl 1,2-cyclic phosphodiesterase|nr:MBL fold metallo-hydrolase [Planctomycetota bacterium]MDP6941932.1 MBL fold metallo-hydrolase [Planctomycetota bacterium]
MEIILLASGSSGNCALVRAGDGSEQTTLLLDAGIAMRTARGLASEAGVNLAKVKGVLLTHAHSDHSAKVVPLAARAKAPLWAHPDSLASRSAASPMEISRRSVIHRPFESGKPFTVGSIQVTPVLLNHDSHPTHGFLFAADGERAGFFTDTGTADALTPDLLHGLDYLVLESNHDPDMLRNGHYPPFLKDRVGGDLGHLSNQQAAKVIQEAAPNTLKRLVLAHLSDKNNTPQLAIECSRAALQSRGMKIQPEVAPKRGVLRVGRRKVKA